MAQRDFLERTGFFERVWDDPAKREAVLRDPEAHDVFPLDFRSYKDIVRAKARICAALHRQGQVPPPASALTAAQQARPRERRARGGRARARSPGGDDPPDEADRPGADLVARSGGRLSVPGGRAR
jgi:hypothetical protein